MWACLSYVAIWGNVMFHAVLHITSNVLAYKYPLTPLHKDINTVIGGLNKFDHFRRGSLNGSLLIL